MLIADRGFAGLPLWRAAAAGGADLLWRVRANVVLPVRKELAALYCQCWEIETALDELKTHQRGPGQVLRSPSPDGVEQEVRGHLLVHYAIRSLMHTAATDQSLDPDRLSFTRTLRLARRQTTAQAGFSP